MRQLRLLSTDVPQPKQCLRCLSASQRGRSDTPLDDDSEVIHRQFTECLLMNGDPDLTLWYGSLLIGHIRNPFCSDATWHGTIDRVVDPNRSEIARRVTNYMDFCADWNERTRNDPANAPDAAEFVQYADLLSSQVWLTKSSNGERRSIVDAPVFFVGGEISWRLS